jgi:hypothetical protein
MADNPLDIYGNALPNTVKGAFKAIKERLNTRISSIEGAGKVWTRMRYADNFKQWLEKSTVLEVSGRNALRVIFIYLATWQGDEGEARNRKIKASFGVEVIQQFVEGTDDDNSTQIYEDFCGDMCEIFLDSDGLAFVDAAGNYADNSIITGGETNGRPEFVDGVLAHRRVCSIDVTFRICKKGVF